MKFINSSQSFQEGGGSVVNPTDAQGTQLLRHFYLSLYKYKFVYILIYIHIYILIRLLICLVVQSLVKVKFFSLPMIKVLYENSLSFMIWLPIISSWIYNYNSKCKSCVREVVWVCFVISSTYRKISELHADVQIVLSLHT